MAAKSPDINPPVECYLVLKKNDNKIISPEDRPEIKDMAGALMSMGNDRNAIFKLAPNKQDYIFDTELLGTALAFKKDPNYTFEVSAEKPENASLYIRVRVNSDNICEHISVVTEGGADYKVQSLSSPIKTQLEETFKRSNYKQNKVVQQVQIFPVDQGMWASYKDFQENSAEQKQNSAEQRQKLEKLTEQAAEAAKIAKTAKFELEENLKESADLKQNLEKLAEEAKEAEQIAITTLAESEKSAKQEHNMQAATAAQTATVAKAKLALERQKFAELKQKQETLAAKAARAGQTAITTQAELERSLGKSAEQEHNITAILTALPPMKIIDGDLILGEIEDRPSGNPAVQSSITISYLEAPSKKIIGITLHQPGNDDIVFNTDDLDIINSCDNPQQQIALLINARIIATPISTMAQAYHFSHMKDQSSTQFAYSDGFIIDRNGDVPPPYNFLINLKTNELRIHCKATNKHVTITDFNINANLTVLIRQFHTAFSFLLGEEILNDHRIALDFLIYICKEIISSRKQSKDEMFGREIARLQSKAPNSDGGAALFTAQNQILTPLKALVAKITRLRNVKPQNQDGQINFELILLLDEIASDIEKIDAPEEIQSATANPILAIRDMLLRLYTQYIFLIIENMSSDNDVILKQQLMQITEALANLVKLEKINYTAVFTQALPNSPEKNTVYFMPIPGESKPGESKPGESKFKFLVVNPRDGTPIQGFLNSPSDQAKLDSLLITTLRLLSRKDDIPDEVVTNATIINQNIDVLINLLWGYTLHSISELPARNNKKGNKIYINKMQFGGYVVHLENGSVVEGTFAFNEEIDSQEFKDGLNLDDSMAILKFVANRISKQMPSDIVIRSNAVIKKSIVFAFHQLAKFSPEHSSLKPALSAASSSSSSASSSSSSASSSSSSASSSSSSASSSSNIESTSFLYTVSHLIADKVQSQYDANIQQISTPNIEDDVAQSHETLKEFLNKFLTVLKTMLTAKELIEADGPIAKCLESPNLLFPGSKIIHSQVISDMMEIRNKISSLEATDAIDAVIKLLQSNQEEKITLLTTPNNDDVSLDDEYLNRFLAGFQALITPEEQQVIDGLIQLIIKLDYLLPHSSMIHPKIITMMIMIREKTSSLTANAAIYLVIERLLAHQESVASKKDTTEYTFSLNVDSFSRFLNSLADKIERFEYARNQKLSLSDDMSAKIAALKKWITAYSDFITKNKWYLFGKIGDFEKDFTAILENIRAQLTAIKATTVKRGFLGVFSDAADSVQRQVTFVRGIEDLTTELNALSKPLENIPLRTVSRSVRSSIILAEEGSSSSVPSSDLSSASTIPLPESESESTSRAKLRAPAPPRPGTGIFSPLNVPTGELASSLPPRLTPISQPPLSVAPPPSAQRTDTLVESEAVIPPNTQDTDPVDDQELAPNLPPRPQTTSSSSEINHQSKDTSLEETPPPPALITDTLIVTSEILTLSDTEDNIHVGDKEKGKEEDKSTSSTRTNLADSPHILLAAPKNTATAMEPPKDITEQSELPPSVSVPVTPPSSPQSPRG